MAFKFTDEAPELNITPLVDIMLVLLAILMVTMPTITYQEDITLPDGSKAKTSMSKQKRPYRVYKCAKTSQDRSKLNESCRTT